MEQPPKMHGSVQPAAVGVASSISAAIMMFRRNITPLSRSDLEWPSDPNYRAGHLHDHEECQSPLCSADLTKPARLGLAQDAEAAAKRREIAPPSLLCSYYGFRFADCMLAKSLILLARPAGLEPATPRFEVW